MTRSNRYSSEVRERAVQPMKCLYCGGEMEKRLSTYTVDRKGYHLFIKEIPAYVCTRCGEKYFDEGEVEAIQKLIRKVETGLEEVQAA